MNELKLRSLDITALLVFHTLLEEGHAGRTANRLGMTQSAVSHALGRMRALWHDPLFVRGEGAMHPTQKALSLAPGVAAALRELRNLTHHDKAFDPTTDRRRFILGLSDYASAVFLPALLSHCAPFLDRITFLVRTTSRAVGFEMLDRGEVECVIGNFPTPPKRLRHATLFEEYFVCAMRADHPLAGDDLDVEAYLAARHVHVSLAGEPTGLPDQFLSRVDKKRHVALTTGHFTVVPQILATSDLIATEPRAVLAPYQQLYDLTVQPPPFETDPFTFSLVWHGRSDGDKGLAWLRGLIETIAASQAG